jgi:hypothetical protein
MSIDTAHLQIEKWLHILTYIFQNYAKYREEKYEIIFVNIKKYVVIVLRVL